MWDSIAHTKFTATYLEGGRCAGSSTIGMCPIPQPRYSYDPVPNSHQAWKYYFGVFDSFKVRQRKAGWRLGPRRCKLA